MTTPFKINQVGIKVIFFDLDDTLCDTIGCRPQRLHKALTRMQQDYPDLKVDTLVTRALESLGEPRSIGGLPMVLKELIADTQLAQEVLEIYNTAYEYIALFPGVEEALVELNKRIF